MSSVPYLQVCWPLVLVMGTAFFVSLLEHTDWQVEGARYLATAAFGLIAVAPGVLMLLPPKKNPSAFPPYYPPMIQQAGGYLGDKELFICDIPWAMAWYGDRNSVWTTLYAYEAVGREDLAAVGDRRAKIAGLYLTQSSTMANFVEDMYRPAQFHKRVEEEVDIAEGVDEEVGSADRRIGWPEFVYRSVDGGWLPRGFALHAAHNEFLLLGHLLVLDVDRWNRAQGVQELYTKPPGERHGRVVDEGLKNP
jgi:hypothetical protein